MLQSISEPPMSPKQAPGHLTFWKNLGQIPRYVGSLDGQMPYRLPLQKVSTPPTTSAATIQKLSHDTFIQM